MADKMVINFSVLMIKCEYLNKNAIFFVNKVRLNESAIGGNACRAGGGVYVASSTGF